MKKDDLLMIFLLSASSIFSACVVFMPWIKFSSPFDRIIHASLSVLSLLCIYLILKLGQMERQNDELIKGADILIEKLNGFNNEKNKS